MGTRVRQEIGGEDNISRTWHWSPIECLNLEVVIKKTYDFIRQEIARMTIHPETGVNPTLRRKKGIAIGVARAMSTVQYGIVACHLYPEEMDNSKLVVGDDGDAIMIKDDSKKAFTVVEKQVCAGCDQLSRWWMEDVDAQRDAVWQKAGHPLLVEAGVSSAAASLPFLEAEVRKAKFYRTLLETVLPFFKNFRGDHNWETLHEMLAYLENFPVWRSKKVVTINNVPIYLRSLDTRGKVVVWIKQYAQTLKTSYSLMALKEANYFVGLELYADYWDINPSRTSEF
ncbi:hypothetical protein EUTSA_v10003326mg [Eutrema salsugineum]|uniref:Uncharacterized protein n=1 Tax=Eutrema salsugineum TaxID=72664 RepID=V4NFA3_EUTSA|nr:hypothetical protein EUTSA_v10003326mg [Eutrema salsugineum]